MKSDRWTLAFPLLCWIVALFSLLSVLSLAATFHHNLDVTPPMGNVIFFGLLGTAGFCMPALSILQSEKLGWQRALSQLDKQIRSARTKFLRSLRRLSATQEIEIVAPALVKSLLLLPPPTPGGRSLPSPTLTPRLLAQRPFIRPRARVGALF
ncbi:exported hypothetical protein [Thiomonas sp. CB3]|nr:exported hypothetical protein [Thiomonas sp. CB3]